jgi:hypothetical protein
MKDVRAITMNEYAGGVEFVVGIAANVIPAFDEKNPTSTRIGQALGGNAARKSSPDDKIIEGPIRVRH